MGFQEEAAFKIHLINCYVVLSIFVTNASSSQTVNSEAVSANLKVTI